MSFAERFKDRMLVVSKTGQVQPILQGGAAEHDPRKQPKSLNRAMKSSSVARQSSATRVSASHSHHQSRYSADYTQPDDSQSGPSYGMSPSYSHAAYRDGDEYDYDDARLEDALDRHLNGQGNAELRKYNAQQQQQQYAYSGNSKADSYSNSHSNPPRRSEASVPSKSGAAIIGRADEFQYPQRRAPMDRERERDRDREREEEFQSMMDQMNEIRFPENLSELDALDTPEEQPQKQQIRSDRRRLEREEEPAENQEFDGDDGQADVGDAGGVGYGLVRRGSVSSHSSVDSIERAHEEYFQRFREQSAHSDQQSERDNDRDLYRDADSDADLDHRSTDSRASAQAPSHQTVFTDIPKVHKPSAKQLQSIITSDAPNTQVRDRWAGVAQDQRNPWQFSPKSQVSQLSAQSINDSTSSSRLTTASQPPLPAIPPSSSSNSAAPAPISSSSRLALMGAKPRPAAVASDNERREEKGDGKIHVFHSDFLSTFDSNSSPKARQQSIEAAAKPDGEQKQQPRMGPAAAALAAAKPSQAASQAQQVKSRPKPALVPFQKKPPKSYVQIHSDLSQLSPSPRNHNPNNQQSPTQAAQTQQQWNQNANSYQQQHQTAQAPMQTVQHQPHQPTAGRVTFNQMQAFNPFPGAPQQQQQHQYQQPYPPQFNYAPPVQVQSQVPYQYPPSSHPSYGVPAQFPQLSPSQAAAANSLARAPHSLLYHPQGLAQMNPAAPVFSPNSGSSAFPFTFSNPPQALHQPQPPQFFPGQPQYPYPYQSQSHTVGSPVNQAKSPKSQMQQQAAQKSKLSARANPDSIPSSASSFSPEKPKKKVDYKPYTLADYRQIDNTVKLGSLGPSIDPEEERRRKEKAQQMKAMAEKIKLENRKKFVNQVAQGKEVTNTMPAEEKRKELALKREKAMEFAKSVPKPKVKKSGNGANTGRNGEFDEGELNSSIGREDATDEASPNGNTTSSINSLQLLLKQQEEQRQQVNQIRKQLGL